MIKVLKSIGVIMFCLFISLLVGLMITTMFYIFFSHPNTCMLPFSIRVVSYIIINIIVLLGTLVTYINEIK
jgi:hypothetical protein